MQQSTGEKAAKLSEDNDKKDKKPKLNNDIRDIRSLRQLDKVNLDFDSPRLQKAMDDLGVSMAECEKK